MSGILWFAAGFATCAALVAATLAVACWIVSRTVAKSMSEEWE